MKTPAEIESRRRDIRQGYIVWCQGEVPTQTAGEMFDNFVSTLEEDAWGGAIDFISRHFEDYLPHGWHREAHHANPYRQEES